MHLQENQEYRDVLMALESGDLLKTLDHHAKLLEGGRYNMALCHAILEWLVEEKMCEQERRWIAHEFSVFEASALAELRTGNPEVDSAVIRLQTETARLLSQERLGYVQS